MTQLVIEICYSSELLQRARLFVTLIYGVTIRKKPLWDRHWSSLIVIESSELLQRARFIVTLICGGPYAVTIQKNLFEIVIDRHSSSLVVIDRHCVLWTPTAGEIIYHFNLWCNHSKETSLRSSLIAIDRHWVLWTPAAGEIIYHFNLWCNHSKETSLRLSLIVIGRHWSSLSPLNSYSGRNSLSLESV